MSTMVAAVEKEVLLRIETGISDGGLSVERCRIPLKYVGTNTCYIQGVLYHTGGGGPKMFSRERLVDTHLTVVEMYHEVR